MRVYRSLGDVPRKRHMYVERDGKPVYEELFGREGFSGPSSLLYHQGMPEAAHDVVAGDDDVAQREHEQVHGHAHLEAWRLSPQGDVVGGRQWLLANDDVRIGLAVPAEKQETLYVNASADEVLFMHKASGTLHSQFGRLQLRQGDYCVIPRGTIHRIELDDVEHSRILVLECTGMVDSPERYRSRNGQLTEASPYSERDIRGPDELELVSGPAEVWLKRAGRVTRYLLDHHPFDVIGWDGTVYPCAFSVHDYEPRAGRFHVPPPTHQVFAAHNLVICNFVPRKVDWDPEAVFLPYHHSNLDSDEVMYYAGGDYAARRGISEGSITHHVGGVPHGPQPGALEASRDKPRETNELAVMIDTFRPLHRTTTARQVLDHGYPFSWHAQ
jgi:homogentisate 1,2-dioxygenase